MSSDLLRFTLPLYFVGGMLMFGAWKRFGAMRRVQDTARSRSATAPQGRVELQGIAWPADGSEFLAPSGTEVVYYALELQREETRNSSRGKRKQWVTVARQRHAPDFFLVDESGVVRVPASEADLDIKSARTRPWQSLSPGEQQKVTSLLSGQSVSGFPPSGSFFGLLDSGFRVRETEIPVGSPLYANGDFRTTAGPESIRARGLGSFQAKFFEKIPGSAASSDFSIARELALVAAVTARKSDGVSMECLVAGRIGRSPENPLYVADRAEEQLATEWKRSVYLPAAGGLAAFCAATWLLVASAGGKPAAAMPQTSSAPASAKAARAGSDHEALRSRCLGAASRAVDACDELLIRADQLGIPPAVRDIYAKRACDLGSKQHCRQ